ncbi:MULTISPECIES: hypothetical protein, partial [unclassified Novosphingobium]|uniref:hypothetical protein n=1 Tax=unclassified Novosphingobium TaxID=2644732 RepID=UPI001AAD2A0E
YQSMPLVTPSSRKDGVNHNILVSLNNFRIGLSGFVACALFSGKRSHSKTPAFDHSRRQRGKEETE